MEMQVPQGKGEFRWQIIGTALAPKNTDSLIDPLFRAWQEALGFPLLVVLRRLKFRAGIVDALKGFELDPFEVIRLA
jgi:hypothetical protein